MAATTSDMVALNKLLEVSTPGVPHVVEHFLYFRDQSIADTALAELHRNDFQTEAGPSAAGTKWLVLARHEIIPSEDSIASTRAFMEALASKNGGEYDGWGAESRRKQTLWESITTWLTLR